MSHRAGNNLACLAPGMAGTVEIETGSRIGHQLFALAPAAIQAIRASGNAKWYADDFFGFMSLSQPYCRASTIFVDEFDARSFERVDIARRGWLVPASN